MWRGVRCLSFLVLVVALAACVVAPEAPPEATDAGCQAPAEGQALLEHEAHGYCLLYPEGHTAERVLDSETILYIGSILNTQDPRLHVEVTDAGGRTAQEVAEAIQAEALAAIPDMDISLEETTLDGVPAALLDGLPGQEITRQLLAVRDGRLYSLVFMPADETRGEAYAGMEDLYDLAIGSFRFVTPAE